MGMSFNADVYLEAAQERVHEAKELYRSRRYVLAHYIAGVAVECLLRAHRVRRNPDFDSRHDLYDLYYASGFERFLRPEDAYKAHAALLVVSARWRNDYRYRSEGDLRRHLRRAGLHYGIKGDYLKESARRMAEASADLMQIGLKAWKRS